MGKPGICQADPNIAYSGKGGQMPLEEKGVDPVEEFNSTCICFCFVLEGFFVVVFLVHMHCI